MLRRMVLAVCLTFAPLSLYAEDEKEPDWKIFDWDRDPTAPAVINAMFTLAKVGKNDILYDLGSGDGRIPIAAAKKFGIKSVGIEFNPELIPRSRKNAEKAGVADKVTFIEGDVFEKDFSEATVITIALWESINVRLSPRLLAMPPGTRIIGNEHEMGAWKPDKSIFAESYTSWGPRPIHLWIVPANIDGVWTFDFGIEKRTMAIEQKYQHFTAHEPIAIGGINLKDGLISGRTMTIRFPVQNKWRTLRGEVQPDGSIKGDGWSATKQ